MGLAKINVRFTVDMQQFSTDMQNSVRKLQQLGTQMNAVGKGLSTYITAPLLLAGGAAVKFASDYQESVNKVEVAFGPASEAVKTFAKDSLTSFGIAEGSALDAAAQYGDMATSMGINQQAASKMSTTLVGLAGDLASFKNIGIDQANTALAGIFTGETESLKKLGIVMTEANLQQFALSKGIKTQIKDMDQASKVNLRYAYIMANTTNAQGDFARTGGGAANQSRIFTESLKQLGQQFGAVILPFFTKAITYINGILKGFSELSPATKTLIVGVAGLAAAIGPLMVGLGNLIGLIPRMIVQFNALKATIIANPYMAAAVGIGLLVAGIYAFVTSGKQAVSTQTALNDAIKKGDEAAASEVGTLDKLYASATNVNVPMKERKKNVDDMQSLYPAYFKNMKDEIILAGGASKAYNELREAIFNKSRAAAIDNELQSRANARIQKEIELRNAIADTEKRINDARKGADVIVLQEASAIEKTAQVTITKNEYIEAGYKLLRRQQADLKNFNAQNLKDDQVLFAAKEEYLKKTGKLGENEVQVLSDIKVGTDAIKDSVAALTPGSIAFFEAQIDGFKKLQKEQATSNDAWLTYQKSIDAIQKKIDALTNTNVKLPKPQQDFGPVEAPPAFSLGDLKSQKSYYESIREEFSTTSDEYKRFSELINNTQIKIDAIEGVDENITKIESFKIALEDFNQSVSTTMTSVVSSFVEGFAKSVSAWASGGDLMSNIGNLFLNTLGGMLQQLGKIAIETGVGIIAIKTALKSLNPYVAIAGGIALVALGSLIQSKASAVGQYANGGIVGGTSYYGDKILARVNSGEMIANDKQQKAIWNSMNAGTAVNVTVGGSFELDGRKLRLVLDRANSESNRIG